ncbi:MAG: hypothetical protein MJZ26_11505 [Fibrobacter sp.]|nr:hypothetical protein [Fibrobacter sp.]
MPTLDEKVKEIASQRESVAAQEPDETSEVKADSPANPVNENPADKEPQQPEGNGSALPKTDVKTATKEQKADYAFAAYRKRTSREMDSMRKELEELRKFKEEMSRKQNAEAPKTRQDFGSDEDFADYIQENLYKKFAERFEKEHSAKWESEQEAYRKEYEVKSELKQLFGNAANDILNAIEDEHSDLSVLLNHPNAEAIRNELSTDFRADFLGLMYKQPERFFALLQMSPTRQEIVLMDYERQIRELKAKHLNAGKGTQQPNQQPNAQPQQAKLPTTGRFGNGNNGSMSFGDMSAQSRVNRFMLQYKKKGF